MTNPTLAGYRASNPNNADWSIHTTRELALSLPPNNDATGTPDITGRALAGQTLTAGMADIADADGLPNASDFAWQWIRAADETDTPIQDATSSTYTLTDDDAGKQVKVVMSFTDSLSGVELLTSDAYPSSSTVQRVLVSNIGQTEITQNDDAGELLILDAAQEFTTGSNETGYTLSSIDLELTVASTSNFPVVKLFSGSANGTEVATLTAPTNASTGKTTYTFTVPTAITLEGNTSYWHSRPVQALDHLQPVGQPPGEPVNVAPPPLWCPYPDPRLSATVSPPPHAEPEIRTSKLPWRWSVKRAWGIIFVRAARDMLAMSSWARSRDSARRVPRRDARSESLATPRSLQL